MLCLACLLFGFIGVLLLDCFVSEVLLCSLVT